MHVLTLVLTDAPRDEAYQHAYALLHESGPKTFDYFGVGGRFPGFTDRGLLPAKDRFPYAIPVEDLPRPLPGDLMPVLLVTPRGARAWEPLDKDPGTTARWTARVNRLIDQYREGHVAVLIDAHF